MNWFHLPARFSERWRRKPLPLPTVNTPVAHLVGVGTLEVDNGRLCFVAAGGKQLTLSVDGLELVVAHGGVTVTPRALALLAQCGAAFALLAADGQRCLVRLDGMGEPKVLTRVLQYRLVTDVECQRQLAYRIVAEKIHSQCVAVRHYQRQGRAVDQGLIQRLEELHAACVPQKTLDELRGLEGAAAALWFERLGQRRQNRSPRDDGIVRPAVARRVRRRLSVVAW